MSEPFAPHPPANSLVASTAISPVTAEVLEHAGQEAARLIGTTAGRKAGKSGRKAQSAAPAVIADAPVLRIEPADAVISAREDDPVHIDPPVEAPATREAVEPLIETAVAEPQAVETIAAESVEEPIGQSADLGPMVPDGPVAVEALETALEASVAKTSGPEQAPDVLAAFGTLFADAFQTNLEATLAFWTSMAKATSPAEILDVNTAHLRRRMDSVLAQSREFSALTRKLAFASMTGTR